VSAVEPRFFVDENLLPVGRALAVVRRDVVNPGRRLLPEVPTGTDDVDWVAVVGARGLVAITRDKHIRTRPAERLAIVESGARLVCITARRTSTCSSVLTLWSGAGR
jgi:hypothetical protein